LQCLYFLIWVKNTVWAWVAFKVYNREYLKNLITDYLKSNGYPEPGHFERSAEGYLTTVAEDDNQPIEVRLKAAASLAELNFMSMQGQFQNLARLSMAYEDALENHKRSFVHP
jgi:hypothetical protein